MSAITATQVASCVSHHNYSSRQLCCKYGPSQPKTAGHAKKSYLTGVYPNGNKVKPEKLEALFTDLMAYADTLEPAHARNLKTELHKRSTQLSLANVSNKADQVHEGSSSSHSGAIEMVEYFQNGLKMAKAHARVTKDVQKSKCLAGKHN